MKNIKHAKLFESTISSNTACGDDDNDDAYCIRGIQRRMLTPTGSIFLWLNF
jgi:hypothetical protein